MKQFLIYAGGEFKNTNNILEVINPYNNEVVATTYLGSFEDLEFSIEKALEVKKALKEMPSYLRYQILDQIARELELQKTEFSKILCLESGKPWKYAAGEVDRAIQTFRVAAEESKRLPMEFISLDWTPSGEGKEGIVKYFPVGLVAGISPFNFPLNLAVHKIAPAIASGCPIVLKPSTLTPLSTLALAEIIHNTMLPRGAVSVLPLNRETGNYLVTDDRIKLLSFTGSPAVGWGMKNRAGKKKVILELGGNAGVIVTGSCNVDDAVKKCLTGAFSYSGQVCIHAQRIYVEQSIFEQFTNAFLNAVRALKSGNPLDPETDISVMIDEGNAQRVEAWVNEAVDGGATVLCGGVRKGAFYEPTVLVETKSQMKVCALEIFGPVVTLESFDNFDEAIHNVNSGNFGLQAGVFTNNISEMNAAFRDLDVGGVIINDVPTFRVDHMPYGGIKDSGLGREGVKYAIKEMMEEKILVKSS